MLTEAEKEKVLISFNQTATTYTGAQDYCSLFYEQCKLSADNIAVIFEEKSISYSDIDKRSNQIAKCLLEKGISKETIIALYLDRSPEMITGILGILKAGAAYLPIDPEYPAERIKFMLDDAAVSIILTNEETLSRSSVKIQSGRYALISLNSTDSAVLQFPDTRPEISIEPENLAYVIFTSGSTGRPKGVMNEHKGLVNRLKWAQSYFNLSTEDVVLQKTTYCFDVSVWELLWPIMVGAKLVFAKPDGQKDSNYIESLINKHQISTIHFVPSMLEIFLLSLEKDACKSLKRVLCSGEELSLRQASLFRDKLDHAELYNLYGPTEAAIDVSCWTVPAKPEKISIGKPVANTSIYILDEQLEPCAIGEEGELYIGGIQVARGYLNRPELDAERFLKNPFTKDKHNRLYRSGDLARWLADGTIEYLGRADQQVKIRGFRIEPGEIENVILEFGGIKQCFIHAQEDLSGDKKLIAYIIDSEGQYDTEKLKSHLKSRLPDYMIPSFFMDIPELPLNSSGKADRKALPAPGNKRPELQVMYKSPANETEKLLSRLWSSILNIDKIGVHDNFFDLGGNSLLALRLASILKQEHRLNLPVTKLYQEPTIAGIAKFLSGKTNSRQLSHRKTQASVSDIAVISMSGRFPGAGNIEELWELLKAGKETTSFFQDHELDPQIPAGLRNNPDYVKARGIINEAEMFDAKFFGMNKKTAELMDPQQRIFLEIAWEALESSGYLPQLYDGKIGVFAGSGSNTYYLNNIHTRPDLIESAGSFNISTLNEKDYIAMRTAFELNLKGPAISVYSACSTSLLAIAQAVESLRKGQCDIALAGGSAITSPINSGHLYEEGAILSRDGHCRPFDADASGTVFSDGAGVVLLKNKADAERDGDTIYAIIKGIGLNNDGAVKASFTAPNAEGQAETISLALEDAGVEASTISYVETHGTATPIGDPIEIEGLKTAFGQQTLTQFCGIGSIKSNMGHLTHAAGVAGFIKTALSLHYKQLPPSLFFEKANPAIRFEESPFYVNSSLKTWDSSGIRRAGVSSFGVGGTNVHVILEEAPQQEKNSSPSDQMHLISWSAMTERSLNLYAEKLRSFLRSHPETGIADIAYTLQFKRQQFPHRRFILAADTADLIEKLNPENKQKPDTLVAEEDASELVFMFPGQGSQYANMGAGLYAKESAFREAVDQCAELLLALSGEDIRTVIFSDSEKIHQTRYTQPALFITEYALAKLWMSWGLKPAILCGHSIGEFAAAHLAGMFSLQDALKLVSERARLVSELPEGSMLAVKISAAELEKILPATLSIAAINSKELCVVSGRKDDVQAFSKELQEKGFANRLLKTSHAFHSYMMEKMQESYRKVVETVQFMPPRLPIVSSVSGKWMSESEATDPDYWVNQIRLPVRFSAALETLGEEKSRVLLETGPGNALSIFARQHSLNSISGFEPKNEGEYAEVLRAVGKLWQYGINPDPNAFYDSPAHFIKLPTYAFDRQRCWVEPGQVHFESSVSSDSVQTDQQLSDLSRKEILIKKIRQILENASGIEMATAGTDQNFIEIGLDSLLLTQVAITLKKEFSVPVTFRQLNEDLNSLNLLAEYLDQKLPAEVYQSTQGTPNTLLSSQNQTLRLSAEEEKEIAKPFGASPRIDKQSQELSPAQDAFLKDLILRYNQKTSASKQYTQEHRSYMADPRVVSGFRPLTKEIIYPIVVKRSKGSRIWDLDDNEYIDALNGFGSNLLGFQPDIILNAIKEQMDKGYEIGPQHELAGTVCKLLCEFTQTDRSALCSTGSEAVLGTMRIARTVSGRSLIVAFSGSYHGVFDEVIIRGTKTFRSIPAAPGIMPEAVQNMLILDYGTEESLKIIEERAHELAAVLVEPVQSRRPDFQPVEFLKKLREITQRSGTVLIFDEVITGFRMHPGGAQALFGIKPDLSSYGKVIGGGLPIGAIAGKKQYMDALDGGWWQYGDESIPEVGVTYFAGTFVRHPLALIAAKTSLEYFKSRGPALQEELNAKAAILMNSLNGVCQELNIPVSIVGFGSMWKIKFKNEVPYNELLFTLMREKGIHIWDGFPCFVTESHTKAELGHIVTVFRESLKELITGGFLTQNAGESSTFAESRNENLPPVAGARLGRDMEGNPAWFIADPDNPGKYLQVKHKN